jgi:hypothetical protein
MSVGPPRQDVPPTVTRALNTLSRPVVVDRIVYATITVMSVLIIYDGWQQLRLVDVVLVIVGPIIAMFVGHVFSATLAEQVELGRPLTRRFVAARRAGLAGWRVVAFIAAGLVVGSVVLLLQVVVQPGKAFSGGVAIG